MIRVPALLVLIPALLTSPTFAQEADDLPLTPAQLAAQNMAIAVSVQEQLLGCWSLPEGYADHSISVRLAFLGNGALDGDPYIEADSIRTAGKYPVLMQSIVDAVLSCLPFDGLEDLGAGPGERFDITVHFSS
jgi:hypothetical protein